MRLLRPVLPALLAASLLTPALPASAADIPSRHVDPEAISAGKPPTRPFLDIKRQAIVDDTGRTALRGDTVGRVREVHRNGADGWVAASSSLNHTAVYRVAPDGELTRLIGDRENPSIHVDEGRVVQDIYPNNRPDIIAAVYDVATGDRIARIHGRWIEVHDYRDGLVWMTLQREQNSPERLVTWDPDTDEIVNQGRRGIDGVDLDRGAAWKFKGLRKVRVMPLADDAGWEAWTSNGFTDVDPAFSPDGEKVVTYTRRKIGRDTAVYPGSMVVRDADTGEALRKFNGTPTGDVTVWENNKRFVSAFWRSSRNGADRAAHVRLTTSGGAHRVSPFSSWPLLRTWVQ